MFNIKILFLSLLEEIFGAKELTLSFDKNSTVRDTLKVLATKFGKDFETTLFDNKKNVSKYIIISLNGKDIRSSMNLDSALKDGDELAFLPAIAGG